MTNACITPAPDYPPPDLPTDLAPVQPPLRIGTSSIIPLPSINRHIVIKEDASIGNGGRTWEAAEYLTLYLEALPGSFWHSRAKIVELGAGTGVLGFAVAMLLSHHNAAATMNITDLPVMLPLISSNAATNLNQDESSRVRASELVWGGTLSEYHKTQVPYDLILCADCVYLEGLFEPLLGTLEELACGTTEILLCSKKRRRADKRFFTMLKKKFHVEEVKDAPKYEEYTRDGLIILRASKKTVVDANTMS
ncbi:hypothetical protein SeMB42_g00456 [Synchytrium endobioticum]|uniref:Elongation factor methyltransferase 6 n=1 Tax=Synchytrium endobioticum TaxID=286115 RepID=A0A507DJG0_9FUNG|nr:hypothetical protein SeLEV6574_g00320 [Synchytrium endobioticum]TPX54070.1 hypothetical protein SeMB42_g00456 [Synchytrium endobioticum]